MTNGLILVELGWWATFPVHSKEIKMCIKCQSVYPNVSGIFQSTRSQEENKNVRLEQMGKTKHKRTGGSQAVVVVPQRGSLGTPDPGLGVRAGVQGRGTQVVVCS